MTSAKLTLPNGTTVTVEGTADEVASLLQLFSGPATKSVGDVSARSSKTAARGSGRGPGGPTGYIRQLKAEGYFKTRRTLTDVRKKLEEMGHIYPDTHISPRLLDLVRTHVLGRIKEDGVWKYVDR